MGLGLVRLEKSRAKHYKRCIRELNGYIDAVRDKDEAKMKDLQQSILEKHLSVLAYLLRIALTGSLAEPMIKTYLFEFESWLTMSSDPCTALGPFFHKPKTVKRVQGEIEIDFGEDNKLYLCKHNHSIKKVIRLIDNSYLTEVEVSPEIITLHFGPNSIRFDRRVKQSMFLIKDDRLAGVW